jgi:thiamine pyrophosphokinase
LINFAKLKFASFNLILKFKNKTEIYSLKSSHHIVRDDQEPALIIASCLRSELLGQLLEWSPLVIVLDSAMERVMKLDIKVDVLLEDFDRDFDAEYYKNLSFLLK